MVVVGSAAATRHPGGQREVPGLLLLLLLAWRSRGPSSSPSSPQLPCIPLLLLLLLGVHTGHAWGGQVRRGAAAALERVLFVRRQQRQPRVLFFAAAHGGGVHGPAWGERDSSDEVEHVLYIQYHTVRSSTELNTVILRRLDPNCTALYYMQHNVPLAASLLTSSRSP